MGSSQESKDLSEFSQTDEGKSIQEIGKSSFEQNIYVCGNYNLNFFEQNICQPTLNPKLDNISYYIKMSKHKQIKEWHFFFSPKISDIKKIKENTKLFINEHKKLKDLDDFKEGSKTRINKTTILYFNDTNTDGFIKYFLDEHNSNYIPFIIFIGAEKTNIDIKNKINDLIIEKKKEIDSNLFKYSTFNENVENNLINININLIECAAYYNELGDEFKFPKKFMDDKLMEKDLKEFLKNFSTFNILVCGRPGAGKSTFINGMIKAMICKAAKGEECSQRIIKYIHRKFPLTFFDTPGISTDDKIQTIIDLIKKKNIELGESKSKIHAIFYVVNSQDQRFFCDYENKIFKFILVEIKIP